MVWRFASHGIGIQGNLKLHGLVKSFQESLFLRRNVQETLRRRPFLKDFVRHFRVRKHGSKVTFGFSLGLVGGLRVTPVAKCASEEKDPKNRLVGLVKESSDRGSQAVFQWRQFFSYLWPHIWYLLVAVACALVVAALNIQIPQMLGNIVNVVSRRISTEEQQENAMSFLEEIKAPAFKMIKLYVAQGLMTFGYIFSLSCVGKKKVSFFYQNLQIRFSQQRRTSGCGHETRPLFVHHSPRHCIL